MKVMALVCLECGDVIWSRHRHDMRYCSCKATWIDGGRDYVRYELKDGAPEPFEIDLPVQP